MLRTILHPQGYERGQSVQTIRYSDKRDNILVLKILPYIQLSDEALCSMLVFTVAEQESQQRLTTFDCSSFSGFNMFGLIILMTTVGAYKCSIFKV